MLRQVLPEILDHLPADDPEAIGSRRDLRRINFLMGNKRWIFEMAHSGGRASALAPFPARLMRLASRPSDMINQPPVSRRSCRLGGLGAVNPYVD
jgi:hypothetical protein